MSTHCDRKVCVVVEPLCSGRVSLPSSGCAVSSQEVATGSIVFLGRAAFYSGSEGVPETIILFVYFCTRI